MQFNGYSKVVYELSNELSKYEDIDLHVFGFQNFYAEKEHTEERKLPDNVTLFDPFAKEEKGGKGFGDKLIKDFVVDLSPDIVILYNDLIVVSGLMKQLVSIENRKFRIVPYIDLVYQNEKKKLLDYIHKDCDSIIAFTEYWKGELIKQDFEKKIYVLNHAFNKDNYFPIPKSIARKYFDIDPKDFIILNLNRNQPRKRWDICIQAYIKFLSRHRGERIRLLVMTNVIGCWDLIELMRFEGKKYGFELADLKQYFTFVQNPQKISDAEINVMYNVADIGWNTCDGEGFGLCNFEQAGVGVPQVVPNVGGFKDFFREGNSILVEPVVGIYGDSTKDACGGLQEICSVDSHVEALEMYYTSRDLIKSHGKRSRADILKYNWREQGRILRDIIFEETDHLYAKESSADLLDSINQLLHANEADEEAPQPASVDGMHEMNVDIEALINEKIKQKERAAALKATSTEKTTGKSRVEDSKSSDRAVVDAEMPKMASDGTPSRQEPSKPHEAKTLVQNAHTQPQPTHAQQQSAQAQAPIPKRSIEDSPSDDLDNLSPNDLIKMQQRIQTILNKKNNLLVHDSW